MGVNMERKLPIGMQPEAAVSDLERKIEMDSGPQTRNQVFDKVQKWRVEVPVAEACPPMSPPPVDNIAGLDSTLPRTVERPDPLRVNYVAGPPPKRGFIDTSVVISDHEDDDYELIDHRDAAVDDIGYFGTVVKGS